MDKKLDSNKYDSFFGLDKEEDEVEPGKLRAVKPGEKPQKKKQTFEASRDDAINLIYSVLGVIKKDYFTDKVLFKNSHTEYKWKSAKNAEKLAKSEAKEESRKARAENVGLEYPLETIELAFSYLDHILIPEKLFDVPVWDGVDRIKQMANALVLNSEKCPFTNEEIEEFIKDWYAKAWDRIDNPKTRNRILLITGPQNIGKDWWIDNLVGAFDRWQNPLYIGGSDNKDLYRQLSENAILTIPEFDRANRLEASLLKDIVTRTEIDIRRPYEADSEQRNCRASFISSCNLKDILRDSTGATRYIILEIEKIKFDYPNHPSDQAQLIAQGKYLQSISYRASEGAELKLKALLDELTPESLEDLFLRDWFEEATEWLKENEIRDTQSLNYRVANENPGLIPCSHIRPLIKDIGHRFNLNLKQCYQIFKTNKLRKECGHENVICYIFDPILHKIELERIEKSETLETEKDESETRKSKYLRVVRVDGEPHF